MMHVKTAVFSDFYHKVHLTKMLFLKDGHKQQFLFLVQQFLETENPDILNVLHGKLKLFTCSTQTGLNKNSIFLCF